MAKKVSLKPIGIPGLNRWGGQVYEEFLYNLRWPYAAQIFKEMADNDAVIGSILYLAEMLIRKANWYVEAASDKARDKKAAEFVESCMHDMSTSWEDTVCEIISMLTYGFSFHEVTYKLRKGPFETDIYRSKFKDGKVGWRGFPIRAQSSLYEWEFNEETGDIVAFVQMAPPNYKVQRIPLESGLLFRTRVNKDNPEGKSLLRNAYRAWYFKKKIEEIEGIGIERDLAGLPILVAPEGLNLWDSEDAEMASLRVTAESLISGIRRDSEEGILLPYGWDLKLLSTGSARQFDTNAIISRYDHRIAAVMLSDIVLIGNDKTGSFALADTKKSLLAAALEAQLNIIANTINKYQVPKLLYYNNFNNLTDYPQIHPGQLETPDIKEISLLLRAMGLDITKDLGLFNYVRRIASMPILDEKEFNELYKTAEQTINTDIDTTPLNDSPDALDKNPLDGALSMEDMRYTGM